MEAQKVKISKNVPYIIAETAYSFEGDQSYLMEQTLQLPENVDAIKYHILFDIDEYMEANHSVYSFLQNWILEEEDWISILKAAKGKHDVIVLADDRRTIHFLEKYPELIDGVEIHAACVNDKVLFSEVIGFANKYFKTLFVGISGFEIQELFDISEYIRKKQLIDVVFMYGFQNYPTKIKEIRLSKIPMLQEMFKVPVGYADHTGWDENEKELLIYTAYALGANIQEIHFVLKEGENRTDAVTAVDAKRIAKIVNTLKHEAKAINDVDMRLNEGEKRYLNFRKVPVYADDLKKGYILKEKDIKFIRVESPLYQHKFSEEELFIGRALKTNVYKNTEIVTDDFCL